MDEQVTLVDLLLRYLPHCETEKQKDAVLQEVRRLRQEITFIEEMTRTEKHKHMRTMKVIIESEF